VKLSINRAALLGALSAAVSTVKQRPTLAILTNVRLSTGALPDGTPALRVEATDLDITVSAVVPLNPLDLDEGGVFLTDAKRMFDAVKSFSGENVGIDARTEGKVRLTCEGASFALLTVGADDFPTLPSTDVSGGCAVNAGKLAHQFAKALIGVSYDESRPNLMGVYVVPSGNGAKMAATDGHRLVECVGTWAEGPVASAIGETGFIVPAPAVGAIKRVLESGGGAPAAIALNGDGATFLTVACHHTTVSVRLVDAAFPDYRSVIPKKSARTLVVMKALLISALRRVQVVASSKNGGVRMHVGDERIRVSSDNPTIGASEETIGGVRVTGDTGGMEIAFNAKYVADALSILDGDDVRILLTEALSPGLFMQADNDDVRCVVMPMRI
jgi:DNA polymerase-3 subunit beta